MTIVKESGLTLYLVLKLGNSLWFTENYVLNYIFLATTLTLYLNSISNLFKAEVIVAG